MRPQIKFWDFQLGVQTLTYNSGHHNNVFQASCAARCCLEQPSLSGCKLLPVQPNMPPTLPSQARIMPHSGNGTVVSCAADGLVRVGHIPPGAGGAAVETRRLACHRGRAHKLALEPDSASCFLSCGEGGLAWGAVWHFGSRGGALGGSQVVA